MPSARFGGKCKCGGRVEAGDPVTFADRKIAACGACDPKLGARAAAPPLELRVRVVGVKFVKPDGTWTSASAVLDQGQQAPADSPIEAGRPFAVVGPLGSVAVGDVVEVRGKFIQDERWGWQFEAGVAVPAIASTDQALVRFLQAFPDVGPRRAEAIVRELGGRQCVLDALDHDPERLTVVSGITSARAQAIADKYHQKAGLRDTLFFLAGLGIAESSALHAHILERFGESAKAVLSEDPYQLMDIDNVGFTTADEYARKLGIGSNDVRRTAALVLSLIQKVENEGHVWSSPRDLLEAARGGKIAW